MFVHFTKLESKKVAMKKFPQFLDTSAMNTYINQFGNKGKKPKKTDKKGKRLDDKKYEELCWAVLPNLLKANIEQAQTIIYAEKAQELQGEAGVDPRKKGDSSNSSSPYLAPTFTEKMSLPITSLAGQSGTQSWMGYVVRILCKLQTAYIFANSIIYLLYHVLHDIVG